MARKKAIDASGVLLVAIIAIVFVVLFALAFAGPLAIFIWWCVTELKARQVCHIKSPDELLATQQEIQDIASLTYSIETTEERMRDIQIQGDKENLLRRIDGRFDERSPRARVLNAHADSLFSEIDFSRSTLSDINREIYNRLERWKNLISNRASGRLGVASWLTSMIVILNIRPEWVQEVGVLIDKTPGNAMLIGASASSTVISTIIMLFLRHIWRISMATNR